jgi:hypothetical protein
MNQPEPMDTRPLIQQIDRELINLLRTFSPGLLIDLFEFTSQKTVQMDSFSFGLSTGKTTHGNYILEKPGILFPQFRRKQILPGAFWANGKIMMNWNQNYGLMVTPLLLNPICGSSAL